MPSKMMLCLRPCRTAENEEEVVDSFREIVVFFLCRAIFYFVLSFSTNDLTHSKTSKLSVVLNLVFDGD